MKNLISILKAYSNPSHTSLGNSKKTIEEKLIEESNLQTKRETLQIDLANIIQRNTIFFIMIVVMLCVLFVGSIVSIIIYINDLDKIQLLFGSASILTILLGFVQKMQTLWKEKINSELLLALIKSANEEAINSVISILINRL